MRSKFYKLPPTRLQPFRTYISMVVYVQCKVTILEHLLEECGND